MEEASECDTASGEIEQSSSYAISEVLLFLIASGLPETIVYGWHPGWDFERLLEAFRYFKKQSLEKQKNNTLAVALGVSSLLSKEPLEKFLKETSASVNRTEEDPKPNNGAALSKELNKMMGVLDG